MGACLALSCLEKTDELAAFTSVLRNIQEEPDISTEGGVRQVSRARTARYSYAEGFGMRRTDWHGHAL